MFQIALLGAGRIGRIHAANVAAHPELRLRTVVDPVAPAAATLAAETGGASDRRHVFQHVGLGQRRGFGRDGLDRLGHRWCRLGDRKGNFCWRFTSGRFRRCRGAGRSFRAGRARGRSGSTSGLRGLGGR